MLFTKENLCAGDICWPVGQLGQLLFVEGICESDRRAREGRCLTSRTAKISTWKTQPLEIRAKTCTL